MKDRKNQERRLSGISHFFLSGPELKPKPAKEKFTIQMAARVLGVSKGTIITYLNDGSLTRIKEGDQIYISRDEVNALNLKLRSKSSVTISPQTNINVAVPIEKQQSIETLSESDNKSTVAGEKNRSKLLPTRFGLLENEHKSLLQCKRNKEAKNKEFDILKMEVNKPKQDMEILANELSRTETRLRDLEKEQQKLLADKNKTTVADAQREEEAQLRLPAVGEKLKGLGRAPWQKLFDLLTLSPERSGKKGMVLLSILALLSVMIFSVWWVSRSQKQPMSAVTAGRILRSETVQLTSEALLDKDLLQTQSSRVPQQRSEPHQTKGVTDSEPEVLDSLSSQAYFLNANMLPSLDKRVSHLSEVDQQVAGLPLTAPSYILRAETLATTWLHLVIDDRQELEYMLHPNEKHTWGAMKGFKLHIGNAAGLQLYLNNQPLKALGESGKVVHLELPDPALIVTSN